MIVPYDTQWFESIPSFASNRFGVCRISRLMPGICHSWLFGNENRVQRCNLNKSQQHRIDELVFFPTFLQKKTRNFFISLNRVFPQTLNMNRSFIRSTETNLNLSWREGQHLWKRAVATSTQNDRSRSISGGLRGTINSFTTKYYNTEILEGQLLRERYKIREVNSVPIANPRVKERNCT